MKYSQFENIINTYPKSLQNLVNSLQKNEKYSIDKLSLAFFKTHRLTSFFLQQNLIEKTDELKLLFQKNLIKNLELLKAIIIINRLFEIENVKSIFLKGVVLSQQTYNDIRSRECRDIDLLIEEKDILIAHKILIENQYLLREKNKLENKTYRKYFHHVSYWNPAKKIMLELHWRPFSIGSFFPEKNYSKISRKISVSNHELSVLDNEYNLIYLCIHGALHIFSELIWLLDIAKFINTQVLDWNKIQQISKEWKIERPINLSIYLASYICNATIPEEYMNPDQKTKKLINIVLKQLPNEKRNLAYKLNKLMYFINLKDGLMFKWNNLKYRFFRALI